MTEILNLNALCRCCHADGYFKGLQVPYKNGDIDEIYSALLHNTFGVTMNQPPVDASHTICDDCIQHLRAATDFKQQVLKCETKFMEYCNNEQALRIKTELIEDSDHEVEIKSEIQLENESCDVKTCDSDNSDSRSEWNFKHEDDGVKAEEKVQVEKCKPARRKTREKKKPHNRVIDNQLELKVANENGGAYSCRLCEGTYTKLEELQTHISTNHLMKTTFGCRICNVKFTSKCSENRHMRQQHNKSGYECDQCKKQFTKKDSLNRHATTHTKLKTFKCNVCSKYFAYAQTLGKHMRIHKGTNKQFICDLCGNRFNDRSNLTIHISVVHEKARPFSCTLCAKTYTAKKHLQYHMMQHEGLRPFRCDVCDKTFITVTCLKYHKLIHEPGHYRCAVCQSVFKDLKRYKQHMRTHGASPFHECVICQKTFSCKYSMQRHMKEHNGKAYSCDMCKERFHQKALVIRHIRRKHSGPKVLEKCDVCKHDVENLEKHKLNHVNKPYQCELCERSYSAKTALNRHLRYVHNNFKSFVCSVCGKQYVMKKSLRKHMLKKHMIKAEQDDDGDGDGTIEIPIDVSIEIPIENDYQVNKSENQ